MTLDLSSLQQAVASLASSVQVANRSDLMASLDEQAQQVIKAGVIQNFAFTYELCWKFIQRWLRENRSPIIAEPRTRKELIRLAAREGLIADAEAWFRFGYARNTTSHTYDRRKAEDVYRVALAFLPAAQELLERLEAVND